MNKTIIIGRLTKDIELKTLSSTGTAIVNNTIATSRIRNNQNGERIEETLFLDIVAFNRTAEVMNQYLHKGSKLAVEGYLQQQTWVDNQTGQNRSKIVLIIENMEMLDNKQDNQNNNQGGYQNNYQQPRQNNYQNNNYQQQPRQNQANNYQQPQQNYQNNNYQQGGADELPW
ncbi:MULTISPECIES: single-stranded DNA-binding protein [unclassified Campylobacter]|uniref:single-stranded DNA-binding protein n=1 Tax=unclassified Campylobacter TaxID=2593542 RepID=UPI001BDB35AF|nr:single-stranded DNA-binding protein [Campylobacter sp. 2018MI27]MBT0885455.1 single-stranded DNA-binding protein [Campylobacter sp. 2018MI10]